MTAADLSSHEMWALQAALRGRYDAVARQRAITERRLAQGCPDNDVLTRLAYHEELGLAALDSLARKLLPEWIR